MDKKTFATALFAAGDPFTMRPFSIGTIGDYGHRGADRKSKRTDPVKAEKRKAQKRARQVTRKHRK